MSNTRGPDREVLRLTRKEQRWLTKAAKTCANTGWTGDGTQDPPALQTWSRDHDLARQEVDRKFLFAIEPLLQTIQAAPSAEPPPRGAVGPAARAQGLASQATVRIRVLQQSRIYDWKMVTDHENLGRAYLLKALHTHHDHPQQLPRALTRYNLEPPHLQLPTINPGQSNDRGPLALE